MGKPIHVIKNEHTRVIIIVYARTLKYAPATPLIYENGRKITIVLMDEPTIAGNKYLMDFLTAEDGLSPGTSSLIRCICSATTIASSIINPTEAAIAPNVIRLKV